jgi:3-oxoacyl-[acyl-carrier protein] reductase
MDDIVALVTGVSRGIGQAVARRFASEGAHVIGCARSADALDDLAAEAEDVDGEITIQRADVRDEYDMERLCETAASVGDIDCVVANAGVYHGPTGETPLAEESYAAFDDHLGTNARGVFATVREAVPHLADDARVLVPTGQIAREAQAGFGSYAVSKAAAEALVRGFATELDYRIGLLDLGQVATDLTGGAGRDPEDVAGMFVWAATDIGGEDLDGDVLDLRAWRQATR